MVVNDDTALLEARIDLVRSGRERPPQKACSYINRATGTTAIPLTHLSAGNDDRIEVRSSL